MNGRQCLWYALDQWCERGGYLCFAKSTHWWMPHVLHSMTLPPDVTHYVPPTDLRHPWYSLFGFRGIVVTGDHHERRPMGYVGMLVGTVALLVLGGAWVVNRIWRRIRG